MRSTLNHSGHMDWGACVTSETAASVFAILLEELLLLLLILLDRDDALGLGLLPSTDTSDRMLLLSNRSMSSFFLPLTLSPRTRRRSLSCGTVSLSSACRDMS